VLVEKNQILDLEHSTVELRGDGLVEIVFMKSIVLGLQECLDLMDAYEQILEKKRYPLLHIAGDYMQVTEEARNYGASEEGLRFSAAEAFVINSLAHKLLANFYMKINKPSVPTKFFSKKEDAEEWLKKFL
jgi:hypothetical protein